MSSLLSNINKNIKLATNKNNIDIESKDKIASLSTSSKKKLDKDNILLNILVSILS